MSGALGFEFESVDALAINYGLISDEVLAGVLE